VFDAKLQLISEDKISRHLKIDRESTGIYGNLPTNYKIIIKVVKSDIPESRIMMIFINNFISFKMHE